MDMEKEVEKKQGGGREVVVYADIETGFKCTNPITSSPGEQQPDRQQGKSQSDTLSVILSVSQPDSAAVAAVCGGDEVTAFQIADRGSQPERQLSAVCTAAPQTGLGSGRRSQTTGSSVLFV